MLVLAREVQQNLQTDCFGRTIRGYSSVTSTNTLALDWIHEGAQEGHVVITDYQTEGRGRFGRTWTSGQGVNLLFSIILQPPLPPEHLGLVSLVVGLAVAETVEKYAEPALSAVKWPNDVLLNDKKCCGILLESIVQSQNVPTSIVVAGVGLNVNQDTFPDEISPHATSMLLESGRFLPRAELMCHLLLIMERHYQTLLSEGFEALKQSYHARLYGLHQPAQAAVIGSNEQLHGTITGISDTGALLFQTKKRLEKLYAGEVTFV